MVRFGISTLRSRLLALLLLALVPALVLILVTAWEQRDMAALDAQEQGLRVARLAAQAHERLVGDATALLLALARAPEVQGPSPRACSALFAEALRGAGYRRLAAATPEGQGTVLAQSPDGERWAGQRLPDSALTRALRRLEREGRARAPGPDGLPRFFGYARLPGLPAGEPLWVAAGVSREAAYTGPNRVLLRNLSSLGLVAVVALGVRPWWRTC